MPIGFYRLPNHSRKLEDNFLNGKAKNLMSKNFQFFSTISLRVNLKLQKKNVKGNFSLCFTVVHVSRYKWIR